jgi:hypothetical protein
LNLLILESSDDVVLLPDASGLALNRPQLPPPLAFHDVVELCDDCASDSWLAEYCCQPFAFMTFAGMSVV